MYQEDFAIRLARLRSQRGVSARDMSLSIGQNAGYINTIESGKALPSMSAFFFICDYLRITPAEFFDTESTAPKKLNTLIDDLKRLDETQLDSIAVLVKGLVKK
ncbi:MAG: helix-turn-helix transcriptional regulator [Clostridia bacterium]|nr:helix-turn-helix transcriptional regulator [Clostridia bacterium]